MTFKLLALAIALTVSSHYDLGDAHHTWDCAKLPPTDFKRFSRVYCTDATGHLVVLKVESVTP